MAKILMKSDCGRMKTAASIEEKKNKGNLDEQDWERQTTEHIAYSFGMLFSDGKKIACLHIGFKFCHFWEDFACNNETILHECLLE